MATGWYQSLYKTNVREPSGSFRAQQYAATFPERVGLFVLDAIVPHGLVRSLEASFLTLDGC
jgi:hypothetical protein